MPHNWTLFLVYQRTISHCIPRQFGEQKKNTYFLRISESLELSGEIMQHMYDMHFQNNLNMHPLYNIINTFSGFTELVVISCLKVLNAKIFNLNGSMVLRK